VTGDSYLAIVAPAADPGEMRRMAERAAERLPLAPAFECNGLAVLVDTATRHRLFGEAGIAVGSTMARCADAALVGGTDRWDACRFATAFWGDHVGFFRGPGDEISVIRAPSGRLPAFRTAVGGITLIASEPALLLALTGAEPRIDWRFVAHHLAFPHLRCGATGLAGIDELFAGDRTIFAGTDTRRDSIWTPWDFAAAERQLADLDEARHMLRTSVNEATAALVRPYRSVLLELSGGLDSSVLATALAACDAPATALNLVTPRAEGDERDYARATAAATGLVLAEHSVEADVDLTRPVECQSARPGIPQILAPADRLLGDTARADGVEAFVSGTGGDCVFCAPGSAAPAADALRLFGPGRRFLRAVRHIAEVHDTSLWIAGSMAWRQAHRPPIHRVWPGSDAFLARDVLPREPDFHPWLVEPDDALPGRRSHVRAVVAAFAHLDGYARHAVAPSLFPLLSQPVMETCFRIPTWMWIDGGRDRAIARQAFSDVLPAKVIDRRSKGGMDAYCLRNFEANRARLDPYLLDGHLAGAGLLDRSAVAAYLRQPVGSRDPRFYSLLPVIDAEAWARGWLGPEPGPAGGP